MYDNQVWNCYAGNKLHAIRPTISCYKRKTCLSRHDLVLLNRLRIGHTRLTHFYLLSESIKTGVGKPYIGPVDRPTGCLLKNARLVGRLGSGSPLVGQIGSAAWVSASFQNKCPPRGSLRVRLTLSADRQGRCGVYPRRL